MSYTFAGRVFPAWVDGKKTYLMAAAIVVVGSAQGLGVHIPTWVDWILAAGGLAAHRDAVSQVANDVIDTKETMQTILDTVSTPVTGAPIGVAAKGN